MRTTMKATRTPLDDPWVRRVMASIEETLGRPPALLPNLGGSIPNDVFTDVLAMPTIWVPHSFAGCSQHAPNEHALAPLLREGLEMSPCWASTMKATGRMLQSSGCAPNSFAARLSARPSHDPWVRRVMASIEETLGRPPALLPNLGGSIPNERVHRCACSACRRSGCRTPRPPQAGCSQHAPNEHAGLAPLLR